MTLTQEEQAVLDRLGLNFPIRIKDGFIYNPKGDEKRKMPFEYQYYYSI